MLVLTLGDLDYLGELLKLKLVSSLLTFIRGLSFLGDLRGDPEVWLVKFFVLPWYFIKDSNTLSLVVLGLNLISPASSFSGTLGLKFIILTGDLLR